MCIRDRPQPVQQGAGRRVRGDPGDAGEDGQVVAEGRGLLEPAVRARVRGLVQMRAEGTGRHPPRGTREAVGGARGEQLGGVPRRFLKQIDGEPPGGEQRPQGVPAAADAHQQRRRVEGDAAQGRTGHAVRGGHGVQRGDDADAGREAGHEGAQIHPLRPVRGGCWVRRVGRVRHTGLLSGRRHRVRSPPIPLLYGGRPVRV